MKFIIICVSIFLSPVLASQFLDESEACFVQYLKEKRKLSTNFQSAIEPAEYCDDRLPNMLQSLRTFVDDKVNKGMPDEAECLLDGLENRESVDHLISIYVIRLNKFLNENDLKIQLETVRSQLKQHLESIALKCKVDDESFVKLFHQNLGIRNETLEFLQYEYCISKYCLDNKFLEMENYVINPNNITTDDINCTSIIDIDRKKAEKEFDDEYLTTPERIEVKSCIMQAYTDEKLYEWNLALKVLGNEVNAKRTKETDVIKVTEKLSSSSMSKLVYNCVFPSGGE